MGFYKRRLSHHQIHEADYFLTFRLAGSLATPTVPVRIRELRGEDPMAIRTNARFAKVSIVPTFRLHSLRDLDQIRIPGSVGPRWLARPEVAEIIANALHYRDGKQMTLFAFCIMSTHVHVACHVLGSKGAAFPVTDLLGRFKSYTGLQCNRVLNRTGAFWMQESHDKIIWDARQLNTTIRYILNNPVKAGLVQRWEEWRWSYCRKDLVPI
jgi:REP element-mobilizing transposase RayT